MIHSIVFLRTSEFSATNKKGERQSGWNGRNIQFINKPFLKWLFGISCFTSTVAYSRKSTACKTSDLAKKWYIKVFFFKKYPDLSLCFFLVTVCRVLYIDYEVDCHNVLDILGMHHSNACPQRELEMVSKLAWDED